MSIDQKIHIQSQNLLNAIRMTFRDTASLDHETGYDKKSLEDVIALAAVLGRTVRENRVN